MSCSSHEDACACFGIAPSHIHGEMRGMFPKLFNYRARQCVYFCVREKLRVSAPLGTSSVVMRQEDGGVKFSQAPIHVFFVSLVVGKVDASFLIWEAQYVHGVLAMLNDEAF